MNRITRADVVPSGTKQLLRLRWAALIAACLLAPRAADAAWAEAPPGGLCVKAAVVHHDMATACHAVVGGRLFVFYFVRRQGVWFLLEAKPAVRLPD